MSEPLIVTIPHKLGKEEALRRVKPALGKASESFPILKVEQEMWTGERMEFRVRAMGQVAAGNVVRTRSTCTDRRTRNYLRRAAGTGREVPARGV